MYEQYNMNVSLVWGQNTEHRIIGKLVRFFLTGMRIRITSLITCKFSENNGKFSINHVDKPILKANCNGNEIVLECIPFVVRYVRSN